MDTTVSPPVGQLLGGRYHVGSCIARGGMATVYLATDTRLDRVVALKITHPELSDDTEFVRRFISEARATARLNHPNVVAIYDQGSDGRVHYLAMEYVPGTTLRTLLTERGRLAPAEALVIMTGVLAGLSAAHEAGIAHRDIKPENVLLTATGQVKVADFGLARAVSGAAHTKGGMLIGTAAYLAPEQVSGGASDARTDVYAAGVMLYELVTGVQPHTGDSALAVAQQHVSTPVPAPSIMVPRLPPAVDALVALATCREPDLRPADAGEFLAAVQDVRDGEPIVLHSRVRSQPAVSWPAQDPGLTGGLPAGSAGSAGSAGTGAGASGSGAGLTPPFPPADLVPGLHPVPAATGYPQLNNTMVVPADEQELYRSPPAGHPGRTRRRGTSEPRLQRTLFSRRLGLLAAGLAVVAVLALLSWWLTSGTYTTVPGVHDMTLSTARDDLKVAGFSVRTGPGRHSETVPRGDVIGTDPSARSRVSHGSAVTLIPSLGPTLVAVPSVTGVPLATALQNLRRGGLTPGTVTYVASSSIAAGVVISTNPVAGTPWPRNRPVRLTVSAGPPLPSFVGQQVAVATAAAASGNYQINEVADTKSNDPAGIVTRQSPKSGSPISAGEVVTVWVSSGPQLVSIPNVQGLPLQQAIQQLRAAGFQVTVSRTGFGNKVDGTSPSGKAPAGSMVTVNVGGFFGF